MTIGYQYIPLIIAGLAGMIWGLPAAHRLKNPLDIGAAFVVLCGVVASAFGVLLTFIPDFFFGR
ncbi:MAG TPA: hypothetical protein HPP76_12145 [Desulfuromonadales bacterium]|nr:hypothetical protein [Desulfuromonadales bacterium]